MGLSPGPRFDHTNTRISNNIGIQLEQSNIDHATAPSLVNANEVRIKDSTLSMTLIHNVPAATKPALDVLYKRVAPHAILNKGGRGEDAKCHPGTRTDVVGLVEKWMDSDDSDRMFWMSGPMGGGKTAIMKTIAERSADRGAPTVNFFFFRGDSTRNSAHALISTLLYQLFQLFPSSVAVAAETIAKRPRILDESLDEQCKLISSLFPVIQQSRPAGPPIVLLIDGLDECDVEGEDSQPDILRAFECLVTQADSPFRLLVASRREARIQMAFNGLPSHAHSIFLSAEYSPDNDIRAFVRAEFTRIKASHPSTRSLPNDWPSPSDVEAIVTKSSGQFIYAATVMRYISDPDTPPALSLERVMGVVSTANNSPFSSLDSIYMFILDRAIDRDATRDMLSVKLVNTYYFSDIAVLSYYESRYNGALIQSCISRLSSIVQLTEKDNIQFYHASLTDFLVDHTRSETYWIDAEIFRAKLVFLFWTRLLTKKEVSDRPLFDQFSRLQRPTPGVTHMLLNKPLKWMLSHSSDELLRDPLVAIKRMYYTSDTKTYKQILPRVIVMAVSHDVHVTKNIHIIPHATEYILYYRKWIWWARILHKLHRENH